MSKARKVSRIFEGELKSDELTLADGSGSVQSQKDANVELAQMIDEISDGSGNHDHDGDYSPVGHSHDDKSDTGHDHDGNYAKKIHGHSDLSGVDHGHSEYKTVKDSDQADDDLEKMIDKHATSGHEFLPLAGGAMRNGAKVSFPSSSGTIEGLSEAASETSPVRLKEFQEFKDSSGGSYDDQWVKDSFATEKSERQTADKLLDDGKADKSHSHPDPPLPDHDHPHEHDSSYAKKVHDHTGYSPILHDHSQYKLASEADSEIGALGSSLTAETSARKDGDDALSKRIDALKPFDDSDLQEALDKKFDKAGGDLSSDSAKLGTNRIGPVSGSDATLYDGTSFDNPKAVVNVGYLDDVVAELPPGTVVSDTAPVDPDEGATWYDTVRLELFVFAEDGWLPSSPLGARVDAGEVLQAQILSRVEAGEAKQEVLESSSFKTSGDNTVDTTWRVKSGSKTIISGAEEGQVKIYHLAEPTEGDHAATRSYADGKVSRSGSNDLSGDSWLVRQDNEDGNYRTLIHGDGGQLGLYNLKDPGDSHHAVPRSYVDEKVDAKLDLAGGTNSKMTGNLYMGGNKIAGLEEPELNTDAASKIYVDTAVAGVASGGGPTSKYDGNRFNVSGSSTKQLNENDVMFLQGEATVTHLGTITSIGLPEGEFDWDGCAKSGVVKVMNGMKLAGYFQVFDIVKNEGRNVLLSVTPISFGDAVEVSYETGIPCYFQGVFFA